jgi:FHA domain
MDILGKARKLESKIARKLDSAARELIGSGAREPIEIVNLIVDAAEQEIQSSGRGRRVFPFNRLVVSVLAPTRDARARLEAVLEGEPSLRQRIVERLRAARCSVEDVIVDAAYVGRPQKGWSHHDFHIAFYRDARTDATQELSASARMNAARTTSGASTRRGAQISSMAHAGTASAAKTSAAIDATPARIELTVLVGTAEQTTYSLAADRIDLGRSVEVRDRRHRLVRMNHVAFIDQRGEVNQSVSRQHAHITFDAGSATYRLHDDGSVHGTDIMRNGRTITVPAGSRGVRLRAGDEIVLGDARLRVAFPDVSRYVP